MATTFRLDPEGDSELLHQIAQKFANLGEEIAGEISVRAPRNTGRYAGTIAATTFVEGGIYSGRPIRGRGVSNKAQVWTVVYTTDPRGHLFELGARPRTVVAKNPGGLMAWPPDKYGSGGVARVVRQPGMARRPHFFPGMVAALSRLPAIFGAQATSKRVRLNARIV